ncbi:MAG: CopG family transcriptional regulator [Magnetococcales bacterium]|nr:CopG family transcriptional regulator [Magnetococcales bacterium]
MASVLDQEAKRLSVRRGIADADKGRTSSQEEVEGWFMSLGTQSERPKPTCK